MSREGLQNRKQFYRVPRFGCVDAWNSFTAPSYRRIDDSRISSVSSPQRLVAQRNSLMLWVTLCALLITCFPSWVSSANENNFQFVCANGAVAQIRSDGTIELIDETKLELEKARVKNLLASSRGEPGTNDRSVSKWQLEHIQRKLRAAQKQKGTCKKSYN